MWKLPARLAGALGAAFFGLLFAAAVALAEPNTAITVPVVVAGNGTSGRLNFDRNGRFAVFSSQAQNLILGQETGGRRNVFLYDRLGGSLRLVSHVPGSPAVGGNAEVESTLAPQISADGNWVVYTSPATDMVAGQVDGNAGLDVFLWSRESDTTLLVSRQASSTATSGNAESSTEGRMTVSDDGRYVVFISGATNLIAGQTTNQFIQVYQFDRTSGTSVLVSHAASGLLVSGGNRSEVAGGLDGRAVSADGRFVVFETLATNLVTGVTDANGNFDVYLWDREAALASSLRLLSRRGSNPLATGSAFSEGPLISANGKFVVFVSLAADLQGVTADGNSGRDVFRYDREANLLELVSHRAAFATTAANGASNFPSISAGGDQVAFQSAATNLAVQQDDDNGAEDVFLWRGNQNVLVSHAAGFNAIAANGPSRRAVVGFDGGVGFTSSATDLVAGVVDTNSSTDAFYRPRIGTAVILASHVPSETATGNNDSEAAQVLFGGGLVAVESQARDLTDGPINGGVNLFHHGGLVMADGFESGDTSAWSQVLP